MGVGLFPRKSIEPRALFPREGGSPFQPRGRPRSCPKLGEGGSEPEGSALWKSPPSSYRGAPDAPRGEWGAGMWGGGHCGKPGCLPAPPPQTGWAATCTLVKRVTLRVPSGVPGGGGPPRPFQDIHKVENDFHTNITMLFGSLYFYIFVLLRKHYT